MVREFKFQGKTADELKSLQLSELAKLLPARARRSIRRGFSTEQKKLLAKVEGTKKGAYKKKIKTHARDMVITPDFFGLRIMVHNGKSFQEILVAPQMIGHKLGEFTETRKDVKHSGPGVGATRGSRSQSVK